MKFPIPLLLLLPLTLSAKDLQPVTEIRELAGDSILSNQLGRTFDLAGQVRFYTTPRRALPFLRIGNGGDVTTLRGDLKGKDPDIRVGDWVRARGTVRKINAEFYRVYTSVEVRRATSLPPLVSADEFFSPTNLFKVVRVQGIVRDMFVDESDPNWHYLVLAHGSANVNAMIFSEDGLGRLARDLIGRKVIVTGMANKGSVSLRKCAGLLLLISDKSALEPTDPLTDDVFAAPALSEIDETCPPEKLVTYGLRTVDGQVAAAWGGCNVLLRTAQGKLITLILDSFSSLPPYGTHIVAAGLPSSNFYTWQLDHARWRTVDSSRLTPEPASPLSPRDLLFNEYGQPQIDVSAHGKAICITGVVHIIPTDEIRKEPVLYIKSDGFLVPVDLSNDSGLLDRISVGCTISASGTCVIDSASSRSANLLPHATGFRIVTRQASDVVVVSWPSWWTSERLLFAVICLAALLLTAVVWNWMLRRLADRRGAALMAEQIDHVSAELKTEERTRLAVELHDSLSQTLSGVSFEIDAASEYAETSPESLKRHLTLASRSLESCRLELRNCLWDLRCQALEIDNMDEAIRLSLKQVARNANISIRFNVPRARLLDNTAHAILRIIRELVSNAIRHGKASGVKIAGCLDDEKLLFSVSDNGTGFDPVACPGSDSGHYGLQGIRERVSALDGELTIESSAQHGTKATVWIKLSKPEEEDR